MEQFPIVCICGSTRFEQETKQMAEQLTLAGQVVLMVNCWSKKDKLHEPQNAIDEKIKEMLDKIHKQKIRMADYVLVMNIHGYWGKSTQSEINYANSIGKPVRYVESLNNSKESHDGRGVSERAQTRKSLNCRNDETPITQSVGKNTMENKQK